jgi:primase-polymerase (primpol)-like protein
VIRDRSAELHAFHARHFAVQVNQRPPSTNGHHSELTDEEIIRLARRARNAARFEPLWSGDTRGYPSLSEADLGLVSLLAFYTQDEEQLDSLYRKSGLCRQKWLDRPDYRHRTITRTLSGLTETFTPDDGARMIVGNGSKVHSSAPRKGVADERILRFKTAKRLRQ